MRFEPLEERRLLALVTVTTDQDVVDFNDGLTSLREAIFATNTVPGADTIDFDFGHDGPATILLTMGELAITDDLTIDGPGSNLLWIDASGNDPTPNEDNGDGSRVFDIDDGSDLTDIDVEIRGLTLTGGDVPENGGAIYALEVLTIADSRIFASSAANHGGGIYAFGTTTIVDSTVHYNSALDNGGGIRAAGRTMIAGSIVSDNTSGFNGGGISAFGTTTIVGSNVFGNSSGFNGGGIISTGTETTIADSTVSGNSAVLNGGGIWTSDLTQITGSTISDNSAFGAGGIRAFGTTIIAASTISGNSAETDGGGIQILGITTITDSTISGNSANGSGGGIAAEFGRMNSITSIYGSRIVGNSAVNDGDGMWVSNGRGEFVTTIADTEFLQNSAGGDGGGLAIYASLFGSGTSLFTITGSSFAENQAVGGGGGISNQNGDLTLTDSTISGNAADGDGGGVSTEFGTLSLAQTEISGNTAATGSGGEIYGRSGRLTVSDSALTNNSAGIDGGGIANRSVLAALERSTFSGNSAGQDGGGLANFTSPAAMAGNTFDHNSAGRNGGGIAALVGPFTMTNTTLSGNVADALGGGIWTVGDAVIRHSTATGNHAGLAGGGAFVSLGTIGLNHAIVAGNTALTGPDLTGLLGSEITARYSLVGNNASSGLVRAPVGSPDANGNLIGGAGAAAINPRLGPLADNGGPTLTHALLEGSPAINAGDPAARPGVEGVPVHDQRGAPFTRVFGARIDMGAVETQSIRVLAGDYNGNGVVDAADVTMWRDTMGQLVDEPGSGADGNGDGVVDNWDYRLWAANFGSTLGDLPQALATAVTGSELPSSVEFTTAPNQPVTLVGGVSDRRSAVADADDGSSSRALSASETPPIDGLLWSTHSPGQRPPESPVMQTVRPRLSNVIARNDRLLETWLADRRAGRHRIDERPAEIVAGDESDNAVDAAFAELESGIESLRFGFATSAAFDPVAG